MAHTFLASPVCLVVLVSLMQLHKPDRPHRPNEHDRQAGVGLDRLITMFMKNPG